MALLRRLPIIPILLLLFTLSNTAFARWDDPEYHHYDEILPELLALQEEYPDYIQIDTIGYSQQEHLPFWAVKINEDVNDNSRVRPAVVLNGQVHAEEILGVEYIMWIAKKMMTREARDWRQRVDTYLIPTSNPEGLTVVYSLDNTYRKNKRDNIGDGLFRWYPDWGGDSSGADPNRNFPTFWTHGTSLFALGDNEFYDYYRGPAPASESEVRGLISFMDRVRPLFALTIHSSRTGNVAEQVIYPWGWGRDELQKRPPDSNFLDEMANQIALRCRRKGNPGATYATIRVGNPRGDAETFYYYTFGTNAARVEIGTMGEGMQPNSTGIYDIISDVTEGFEWFLNSAAGINHDDAGDIEISRLDISVSDQATGEPMYARLKLDSRSMPIIPYRYTNPLNGAYYWMVNSSLSDTLRVNRFGYEPWVGRVLGGSSPSRIRVRMTPLPRHDVTIAVNENGIPLTSIVNLAMQNVDTSWTELIFDGQKHIELPEGEYQLRLSDSEMHMPRSVTIVVVDTPESWEHHIGMVEANLVFSENFDGGDVVHTSDNDMNLFRQDSLVRWELTREIYHSAPSCLTDTKIGNSPINENGWDAPYNMLSRSFDLSGAHSAVLTYWLNQALEPGNDSMWVEFSIGGESGSDPSDWDWVQVGSSHQELAILNWQDRDAMMELENRPWNANRVNYMKYHDWENVFIEIPDEFIGQSVVHFRFHQSTDYVVAEDGIYIDDVCLLASGEVAPTVMSQQPLPRQFELGNAYPNPFNGQFSIKAHLPNDGKLNVSIFDIYGRKVLQGPTGDFSAGSHSITINAVNLPSGLYILRAKAIGQERIKKITLIR